MRRRTLTDEQWTMLQSLLPPEKSPMGRPSISHRRFLNAILWLCRTGAPWRDLPSEYGPWRTMATRFYRWQKNGLWRELFARLREMSDTKGLIDWDTQCGDSVIIRKEQHIIGRKERRPTRSTAAPAASAVRTYICKLIQSESTLPSRSSSGNSSSRSESR